MARSESLFSLAGLRRRRERFLANPDHSLVVGPDELEALVDAVSAALRVADHPFGQIDQRDFYGLRETLAVFRRGE